MIRYDGIIEDGKVHFIKFINDEGIRANIPLNKMTAELFKRHLQKISMTSEHIQLDRKNDEESD